MRLERKMDCVKEIQQEESNIMYASVEAANDVMAASLVDESMDGIEVRVFVMFTDNIN